jgi:hypothetical protein
MTASEYAETLDAYREAIRLECSYMREDGSVTDDMGLGHAIRLTDSIRRVLDYEVGRLIATSHAPRRLVTVEAL